LLYCQKNPCSYREGWFDLPLQGLAEKEYMVGNVFKAQEHTIEEIKDFLNSRSKMQCDGCDNDKALFDLVYMK